MEQDHLARILKRRPHIDPTAIDRSEQAVKQLADVGIKLGGYRLEPPLGGRPVETLHDHVVSREAIEEWK